MRRYLVYINGEEAGTVEAPDYQAAKLAAKRAFRCSCDVIG
jgi:hypothetical protein